MALRGTWAYRLVLARQRPLSEERAGQPPKGTRLTWRPGSHLTGLRPR